ncbi:hypothetical protein SEEN447_06561 [Salmonella enterica subsp. enterica serovar Newport str. CVM 19447]|nr:hypothetical protein SEEN447_06561 [Salmonella enterica subsp. enterica serovar Newport str. CVM 19447]
MQTLRFLVKKTEKKKIIIKINLYLFLINYQEMVFNSANCK